MAKLHAYDLQYASSTRLEANHALGSVGLAGFQPAAGILRDLRFARSPADQHPQMLHSARAGIEIVSPRRLSCEVGPTAHFARLPADQKAKMGHAAGSACECPA